MNSLASGPGRLMWTSAFLLGLLYAPHAYSSEVTSAQNLSWAAFRDLTSSQFSTKFSDLRAKGMRMIDVDAYETSDGLRYSMMWQRNDGRGWAQLRNMTSTGYSNMHTTYRSRGWRPTDVEGYMNGNNLRFAGIWIDNRENIDWRVLRNQTSTQYGNRFSELRSQGFYLVDMEAYDTPSGLRYAAIWYRNTRNIAWSQLRNMTRTTYLQEHARKTAAGYVMVDYERYNIGGNARYAAIWHRDGNVLRTNHTNISQLSYSNRFREMRDDGYRPVDFERDGSAYAAIWVKSNTTLADYQHKSNLDSLLSSYRINNSIPGISGAIIVNGTVVWRQGSGEADAPANKVAHGGTIYPLASISKAVGGTLFGRLEERGRLRSGRAVNIALADPTRSHLPTMPAHHAHTLQNLLSHTGCVGHYDSTPPISGQSTHYVSQISAARSLWNIPLVAGCTIGARNRPEQYSTPAFTLLGAAMESATGRTMAQLVREELSQPFGLDSLRVMWGSSTLPSNYERSQRHSGGNVIAQTNNSWKALGGDIESNAVDLARFGWLTGSARMTSSAFRDNNLFRVLPNSNGRAYAWSIRPVDGRRRAQHGGSQPGALTYLGVWPDDGIAIALLSNQRGHRGLTALARSMANLILAP